MPTPVIEADTIEEAAEKLLNKLKEDPNTSRSISSRNNVIYFDGWDGLGASAVLRAIARSHTEGSVQDRLEFRQIIHIDCSKWESRRALQRVVAKQLGLLDEVLEMFDRQDEEDDFRGVAQDSRTELEQVTRVMYQHIQKISNRFLVIFHNGGSEEIDLATFCGFSLSGYSTSKLLWTFQGRYRFKPRVKVDSAMKSAGKTDTFISAVSKSPAQELWSYLVHREAEEVFTAHKNNRGPCSSIGQAVQVAECFTYMLELCSRGHQSIDYDLTTHAANYWICDGIIKQLQLGVGDTGIDGDDNGLWRTADALQHEMEFDVDYHRYVPSSPLTRFIESRPYWASPAYGFTQISSKAIHNRDMFQHYLDKLSVLKLFRCTLNFPSLPFLCCHNLRFLWLDHCQVITSDGARKEDDDIIRCFQRLWVLDVRYTKGCDLILSAQMMGLMIELRDLNVVGAQDWDVGQFQGRLPNIRKLRVTESTLRSSCSENDLFSEMNRMELLDFSGNRMDGPVRSLCGPRVGKSSNSLETVIINECSGLLKISFKGCTNLRDILLSGKFWNVRILDISSTAVKTLDLTTARIRSLEELYLLDCEKLCAIKWPPEDDRRNTVDKLSIDTTWGSSGATGSPSSPALLRDNKQTGEFDWYISVRDARLLGSLKPVYPSDSPRKIYMEISSPSHPTIAAGARINERIIKSSVLQQEPVILRRQQTTPALLYADIRVDHPHQANDEEGDGDAPGSMMWMWPCPDVPHLPKKSCYMHIQDQRGSEQVGIITVPDFVVGCAKILHVRDSLSITILPSAGLYGAEWFALEWCRIERCPELDCVFGSDFLGDGLGQVGVTYHMRTFWASQLPKARYIWKRSLSFMGTRTFPNLTSLYLDCCPRLIHVLPMSREMVRFPDLYRFRCLETLEIMWCGDLREVFPLDLWAKDYLEREPLNRALELPKLKRIHLHELPKLHDIWDHMMRVSAPELETVKIRGCWSLKRLPATKKAVQCDCEKEWWDSLEWEDASQKKLYRPIHSKYYKKATLLRGSVLR